MPQDSSAPLFNDPYSLALHNNIQTIIKDNPKPSSDEVFSQKDLLLLIFKPAEVPKLKHNPAAKVAAQDLYLRLQNEAMAKVAESYNQPPPPSYEEAVASPTPSAPAAPTAPLAYRVQSPPVAQVVRVHVAGEAPPPDYAQACKAYEDNRRYCKERQQEWCSNKVWVGHYYYGCPASDFLFVEAVCYGVEASIRGAILMGRLGGSAASHAIRGAAHIGTLAGSGANCNCGSNKDCGSATEYIIIAVVVAAIALGLAVFATNELIKAYQEDSDSHSMTRSTFVIAPTVLASAAAGYCAFAYVALATGLTVSTGGFALAIAVAVCVTAVVAVMLCKMVTNCVSSHRYKLTSEERGNLANPTAVQSTIDAKVEAIERCGFTFFTSNKNSEVRKLRQEIYNLRTTGSEDLPPSYEKATHGQTPAFA